MKVDDLFKYFILNTDKFTRQAVVVDSTTNTRKIEFYTVNEPLSKDYVKKHLEGLHTIGIFPVKDKKTKWFCIDIDILKTIYSTKEFKREDYLPKLHDLAESIKARFSLNDIKLYKEDTGGKGLHLWIFFDPPIDLNQISTTILPILKGISYDKEIFDVEWFPNSENSKSVKLPGGNNLRYDLYGTFEVPLEKIETVSQRILLDLSNPIEAIFTRCRAFREMKERADIEKHLKHKERVAIAGMAWQKTASDLEWIENYFFKQLANYNADLTKSNLIAFSKGYKPASCKKLQDEGICSEQCSEIGNAKSPHNFYWAEKLITDPLAANDILVDPQDNLEKIKNCFYERARNGQKIKICNFVIDIKETEEFIEDVNREGLPAKTFRGILSTEKGEDFPIVISGEDYPKDEKFKAILYSVLRIGGSTYFSTKKIEQIRQCIDKFSSPTVVRKTRDFGFNSEHTVYYSPSVRVDKHSILPNNDVIVEIGKDSVGEVIESHLDLALDVPDRGEEYWKNFVVNKLCKLYKDPFFVISTFSRAFGIFLKEYYGRLENDSPYILWLTGPSGAGKSRLAFIAQRLFGKFSQLYSFTSSPGRIEFSGHAFKDAIFTIDDYKVSNMSDYTKGLFLALLQNYADKSGRSRITRDITAQRTYVIRGNLLITGEDMTTQEGSNIARTVVLEFYPDDVNINHELFNSIQTDSVNINELTPHMIKWCMNRDPMEVAATIAEQTHELGRIAGNFNNAGRIITNYAKYITEGLYTIKYFWENKNEEEAITKKFLERAKKTYLSQINLIEEENVVSRFWNTLTELISTNRLRIVTSNFIDDTHSSAQIVGFVKDAQFYVIHNLAYNAVTKFLERSSPINTSAAILSKLLLQSKLYVESKRMHFNGKQIRAYLVNQKKFSDIQQLEVLWEDQKEAKTKT